MELTLENLYDIREAIQRRLKEVSGALVVGPEAKQEKARRVNSLDESLRKIEQHITTLQR